VNYTEVSAVEQIRAFAPLDRIIELALGANLELDLAVSGPQTHIVNYAAEAQDPVLPVRALMSANVTLRFVLLYGVPRPALREAAADITRALEDGALTELPVTKFPLDQIAAAHDAVQAGAVGKVLVVP
jgi:NADPH:quinone reductase